MSDPAKLVNHRAAVLLSGWWDILGQKFTAWGIIRLMGKALAFGGPGSKPGPGKWNGCHWSAHALVTAVRSLVLTVAPASGCAATGQKPCPDPVAPSPGCAGSGGVHPSPQRPGPLLLSPTQSPVPSTLRSSLISEKHWAQTQNLGLSLSSESRMPDGPRDALKPL